MTEEMLEKPVELATWSGGLMKRFNPWRDIPIALGVLALAWTIAAMRTEAPKAPLPTEIQYLAR